MFCNKCGAQLIDTAAFCDKCGAAIQPPKGIFKNTFSLSKCIQQKEKPYFKWILIAIVVLVVVLFCLKFTKKPEIHGTWTDAKKQITFTFYESGSLQISGKNNILGAELFQFKDDNNGNLTLQAQDMLGDVVSWNIQYELSEDTLSITVLGQQFMLYRTEDKDSFVEVMENPEEATNIMTNMLEDALDTFQSISLHGTWTDSSGMISFTFQENGTLRIGGLSDMLGADLFTFTEVDNDTLQLKADSDNKLLNMISLNLNYEISGDVMTLEIAGQTYRLIKQE